MKILIIKSKKIEIESDKIEFLEDLNGIEVEDLEEESKSSSSSSSN